MKTCKACEQTKSLDCFYVHKQMTDGYLNFCKECVKKRTKKHRDENLDRYQKYDKERSMLPHRVLARKSYLNTEAGLKAKKIAQENYRKNYPMKYAAHVITRNAIRDGKLKTENFCSVCSSSEKVEAHHDDYTKPLDVRWLCEKCHKEWHRKNKPIFF